MEAEFCVGPWVSLTFSWLIFYVGSCVPALVFPQVSVRFLEMGCIGHMSAWIRVWTSDGLYWCHSSAHTTLCPSQPGPSSFLPACLVMNATALYSNLLPAGSTSLTYMKVQMCRVDQKFLFF